MKPFWKWREWPSTSWGYWDHSPLTIIAVMVFAIVVAAIVTPFVYAQRSING